MAGARFDAFGMHVPLCAQLLTDQSAESLSLVRGRRRLTIMHYACERERFRLADEIDRVTRADRWEQAPGKVGP